MSTVLARFRLLYGASPLHLLGTLAALALTGYTISVLGLSTLWAHDAWWQSILVWFLGAVIAHDLVLFPLYALADRVAVRVTGGTGGTGARRTPDPGRPSALNYVRVPILAVGLLFLMFFPGIIRQGGDTYVRATGQTQDPFLARWLLITAVIFALSALAYATRLLLAARSRPQP